MNIFHIKARVSFICFMINTNKTLMFHYFFSYLLLAGLLKNIFWELLSNSHSEAQASISCDDKSGTIAVVWEENHGLTVMHTNDGLGTFLNNVFNH